MPTGIIITAIICVTLIVLVAMSRSKAKKGVYEYRVVHIENPRGMTDAIEKGIAAATAAFAEGLRSARINGGNKNDET